MTTPIEYLFIGAAVLLLLSILASKASSLLGVPALLLFLVVGMLAGSEGPGGIHFDDPQLAQSLGVVALAYILFAGGLSTEWARVRHVLWRGVALSTLGVLVTALLVGWFAIVALGFSPGEGLLLGAIVSSTDAAAVFAVMRSRNVGLRPRLESLLELESGSNDPMAVFLTIGIIQLLTGATASPAALFPFFVQQMAIGALLGYALGRAAVFTINRSRLEYDGLYPVLSLTMVLLIYGATTVLRGNGFLAVYVAGLVMADTTFIHKNSLTHFHDGLAWLMQIVMFLTLGLLVFPSRLLPVAGAGLAVAVFLMFVARPASVHLTLAPVPMPFREKAMVAWVGLRGAVPIVLATFPLLAGVPRAEMLFDLVFFVVLTSVLLQGPSLPRVARWLGVEEHAPPTLRTAPPLLSAEGRSAPLVELRVPWDSPIIGKAVVELGLPPGAYIVLVQRGDELVIPSGSTAIEADDVLLMAGNAAAIELARRAVGAT